MVKSGAASMAALFAGVSVSATLVIARRVSQRGLLEARRGVRTMVPIPAHLARRAETQAAASVRQWAVQQQQRYTRDAAAKAASSSDSNGEQTAASSSASSSASADTPSSSSSSSSTIPSGAQVVGARLPVPAAPGTGTKVRVSQPSCTTSTVCKLNDEHLLHFALSDSCGSVQHSSWQAGLVQVFPLLQGGAPSVASPQVDSAAKHARPQC